jgi:hypothetical protein
MKRFSNCMRRNKSAQNGAKYEKNESSPQKKYTHARRERKRETIEQQDTCPGYQTLH